jgi:hypothetical protein
LIETRFEVPLLRTSGSGHLKLPRKELILVDGGVNLGDPCEAQAYHGLNGLDEEVVGKIAAWIVPK